MRRGGEPACVVAPAAAVRGVLLDIDDTVIATRAAMVAAGNAAAQELWPTADPELLATAGHRFREDPGGHFRAYTRGEHDFETMRQRRVRDLGRWLGARSAPDEARRWNDHFEPAFAAGLEAFDDVADVLETCREQGWRTALLTNSSEAYTHEKLRLTGIEELVAAFTAGVVTKDTLGIGKPAPEVFHHACRLMGLMPQEVVYIGDELDVDTWGALDAGLGAAWLRRPGYERLEAEVARAASRGLVPAGTLAEVVRALL